MKTILVVDDEPDISATLKALIELHGYRVLLACDGVDALRRASEAPPPDLVITDITMPRMDGFELIERLKASPAGRDIPVIVISAHDVAIDLPFFRKPFDPRALLEAVRRQVGD